MRRSQTTTRKELGGGGGDDSLHLQDLLQLLAALQPQAAQPALPLHQRLLGGAQLQLSGVQLLSGLLQGSRQLLQLEEPRRTKENIKRQPHGFGSTCALTHTDL